MLAFTSCFHSQVTPPDVATSDRQLAYSKKMLTGVYGTLVDEGDDDRHSDGAVVVEAAE